MLLRNLLIAATGLSIVAGAATSASAETAWQRAHPLRVQVNHRINNLNRSIGYDRRSGRISASRAHFLHHRVHSIRMQESRVAYNHGSHIGFSQQERLNREETAVRARTPG
jgi:hypothetical protein